MVKEADKPTAKDKSQSKAKIDEVPPKDPKSSNPSASKDKSGIKKGKKDEPKEEELSEEDQVLKSELEMLVERLKESKTELYRPALEQIKNAIRTSTSSMTAVPKPLKFLRPHYDSLTELYDNWPEGHDRNALADVLSVLGMTYGDEDRLECLKYRLLAPTTDPGAWGHEYVRHLALEIGTEYQKRQEAEKGTGDLEQLGLSLVPFFLKHNAEADAVDMLYELEKISELPPFLDENSYSRVCLYMVSMIPLLSPPDDLETLRTAHQIYRQYDKLPQAMTLAIRLNNMEMIREDFEATDDALLKKQLAYLVARQVMWIETENEELNECFNNTRLSENFLALGKELNVLDPTVPEDIYKSHLEVTRGPAPSVDSAKQNLANSFVNGFSNAGFTTDKLMLVEEENNSYVYKNKEMGMMSSTASIGMLHQWTAEEGLGVIDRYMETDDNNIKAGAAIAVGIINSGVRSESDPAKALLGDDLMVNSRIPNIRIGSIMGLGLAYAGSQREDLLETLLPILSDTSLSMQISAMAALSLGLIFVGSSNGEITSEILETMMSREDVHLKDNWGRFLALGLALLFMGKQEDADATLEALKAIEHPIAKHTSVIVDACAYAGTGNVLKYQSMLHLCTERIDVTDDDDEESGKDLFQAYAVLGLTLIAMGEDIGAEMALRQFGHLMHYGQGVIRKTVPLAMGLLNASNPQMKVYDTLSRYSHDNDIEVAVNAIFAMGLVGAGTKNARLAQLLRQLASFYHRDPNTLFIVRIAQGLLNMGKGTLSVNPFHTERNVLSQVSAAGLLTVLISLVDARNFILDTSHYLLYFLVPAMHPRMLITLDQDLKPLPVNVRVGQAVDVVGQAGRPKTITGWQTQNTPVLLAYGERAELEDDEYVPLTHVLEGLVILKKNPNWEGKDN